ncbi:MAG: TIGR03862 family flavoprotein [Thermomonas sp.]
MPSTPKRLAIVGGGPAGLMAAEVARAAGLAVDLYEAKGSVGRKFLIAGKGGLNLTHTEPRPGFDVRYRERAAELGRWLDDFDGDALRVWARGLGIETYVGTSGRVFPMDRKAAPLLRGWVRRLRESGVAFHVQHRWLGWNGNGELRFATSDGERHFAADALLLAMGGGSWPELGSDGAWVETLIERGVDVAPLQPANCGFDIGWSTHLTQRHAGAPLKPVVAYWRDVHGRERSQQGECVITTTGIEGSLVYALSADLRDAITRDGEARLSLDLVPGRELERLQRDLGKPRNGRSLGEHLRRQAGITGAKTALLHEVLEKDHLRDMSKVAATLKRLPLKLRTARPIAEAISSAGGVRLEALDDGLMLHDLPGLPGLPQTGVFCAGEMLDWEAPTGGYLLTACFASGLRAGRAAVRWLASDLPAKRGQSEVS